MKKYSLIKLDEVEKIPQDVIVNYYRDYINPGIATFLKVLGFDKIKVVSAEGMYVYTECGRKILDFSAALNVLNHGHNHPRIMEARRRFNQEKRLEICKAFVSQYQAVLAKNLAELFPGDLGYTFFCNSGAEANEGALKMALMYHGKSKNRLIHTDIGYHGKTFGAMSVSGRIAEPYKEHFKLLDGCIEVPWGDSSALEDAILRRTFGGGNDIAAMIMEAVKGDLVLLPPEGYLREVSRICVKHNIILIVDEIFTGFCKTGKMFAFEYGDIVPDIVTFSKTLGGGKASISGYIVRPYVFEKTYGSLANALVHSTTYSGMGEECYTAIEALNILVDEGFLEKARSLGEYLLSGMTELKAKHSGIIRDARGLGLLCIFELHPVSGVIGKNLLKKIPDVDRLLLGLIPAAIVSELFKKHDILIYTGGREDNLFVNPALIVTKEEIDRFIDSLDKVLSGNLYALIVKLASNMMKITL